MITCIYRWMGNPEHHTGECIAKAIGYDYKGITDLVSYIKILSAAILQPAFADETKDEWLPLYMRMNYLRHELSADQTNDERKDMAYEIINLEKQINRIWNKRDGISEETTDNVYHIAVNDAAEVARLIYNAKHRIQDTKRKIKAQPNHPVYIELLKKHEADLARLTAST